MSELIINFVKGLLSFSIATLVICVQPTYAFDLTISDDAVQKQLGIQPANLNTEGMKIPQKAKAVAQEVGKGVAREVAKEGTKKVNSTLAAPGLNPFK